MHKGLLVWQGQHTDLQVGCVLHVVQEQAHPVVGEDPEGWAVQQDGAQGGRNEDCRGGVAIQDFWWVLLEPAGA